MTRLAGAHLKQALTPEGWQRNLSAEFAADGTIATLVRDIPCAAICRPVSPSERNRSTSFALILRTIRITPSAA